MGPLFKEGSKRVQQKTESKIVDQLCYIHHNCIHHGYSRNYEDWEFSSYHAYLGNDQTAIAKEEMIDYFGNLDELLKFHEAYKSQRIEMLFGEVGNFDH